jgi:hypothetical protein
MSELPKITNIPIQLEINGVKLEAKKASLYDLALVQDYLEKLEGANPQTKDMKMILYALYLCLKKVYPEITEEYVQELMTADVFLKNSNLITDIMGRLGFFVQPLTQKK